MNIRPDQIAFDFDGVIADTFRLFIAMAREELNLEINYDDVRQYEFDQVLEEHQKAGAQRILDILTNQAHEINLPPIQGAINTLERLSRLTPQLIVTARPISEPVQLWLQQQLPEGHDRITIIASGDSEHKLPILKEHDVRFFIDDRLDTCHQLHAAGITPIVYNQPWNSEQHPYAQVSNWNEINSLIQWPDHPA